MDILHHTTPRLLPNDLIAIIRHSHRLSPIISAIIDMEAGIKHDTAGDINIHQMGLKWASGGI